MRSLLFLLVLANAGFWAWTHWVQPRPMPAAPYSGPGITLLRELPGNSPLQAPREPASPAERCVLLGPFAQAASADAAAAALAAQDIASSRLSREEEIWDGYWVYIERIATREAARAMLAELTANGIADAYIIPDSDSGILISLGVFSEITRAGSLAERVSDLGFDATIADRERTAETTWLRMNLAADAIDVLALVQEPGRINRLERRDCTATPE